MTVGSSFSREGPAVIPSPRTADRGVGNERDEYQLYHNDHWKIILESNGVLTISLDAQD